MIEITLSGAMHSHKTTNFLLVVRAQVGFCKMIARIICFRTIERPQYKILATAVGFGGAQGCKTDYALPTIPSLLSYRLLRGGTLIGLRWHLLLPERAAMPEVGRRPSQLSCGPQSMSSHIAATSCTAFRKQGLSMGHMKSRVWKQQRTGRASPTSWL